MSLSLNCSRGGSDLRHQRSAVLLRFLILLLVCALANLNGNLYLTAILQMQTHLTILDKQMLLYSMVMSPRTSKEILLSIVSTVSTGSFCSSKPPIKITCAQHFGESHGVRNVCFKNCLSSHFKRASPARVFLAACACSQSSRYTSCKQIALAVERRLRQAEVCVHARHF